MKLCRAPIALVALMTIYGCTGSIKLVEDGKVHEGTYDQLSKSIQVTIDGDVYKGQYVQGAGRGLGTAFTGAKMTTFVSTTSDGSGQALLISSTGKVLRCQFGSVVAWRGQGQCQNNSGKIYDLLIGQ